ncbi:MAG: GNAT family N-acetyltransferase [candidate division WOR-3 bacterium]|nr:MAG: GNAT family N-acetyltransferase [candidate division WOR-3 bacterium]
MPERTSADFVVRPARLEDYDAIQPLAEQMDFLHREHLPDRFRRPDGPPRSPEYIAALIAEEDTLLAVAEWHSLDPQAASDARLVGIVNAGLTQTPDVPVKVRRVFVKIRGIVVLPEMRRCGIGRALVREALHWGRERGAVEVQLSVYDYNQGAIGFFRALGFAPLSHRLYRPLEAAD